MKKLHLKVCPRRIGVALMGILLAASTVSQAMSVTTAEKKRCFIDDPTNQQITFIYCVDEDYWQDVPTTDSYVCGSFNSWSKSDDFKLSYDSESKCWYVTVPYSKLKVPGNSGQPEFKFVIDGNKWETNYDKDFLDQDYVFQTSDKNLIVVFSTDDLETIKANSTLASNIRKLSDFDFTSTDDQATISNFRLVPGTTQLYRSYHPFKSSRSEDKYPDIDTENARIAWVDTLATRAGIQSDICLSGDEVNTLTSYISSDGVTYQENIPAYFQKILENKDTINVMADGEVPSYNGVYAKSNSATFGKWVRQVVEFINSHPAPFQIHCRLGTDRTGVISGVIAALCGATWTDIAADYQKSNNMQIQEFRDYKLLAYSLQNMLGVDDISVVGNLQETVADYFVTNGYLTENEINAMVKKLNSNTTDGISTVDTPIAKSSPAIYNLSGQRLSSIQKGIPYIYNRKKIIVK